MKAYLTPKVFRYALIVGIMALVGWLIVEPVNRAQERAKIDAMRILVRDIQKDVEGLTSNIDSGDPRDLLKYFGKAFSKVQEKQDKQMSKIKNAGGNRYLMMALVMTFIGMMMGLGLAVADEFGALNPRRLLIRAVTGAGLGAVGGAVAGIVGQLIFDIMLPNEGFGAMLPTVILARLVAWAFAGMAIGVSIGAVKGSKKLAVQALVGGAIGGGIGGFFFDLLTNLSMMTSGITQIMKLLNGTGYVYGTTGRLFAGTVMGICIGAAIAMIQEYAKEAWVTVLVGRNEGRDYILTKPMTGIGRDELADIPLFGDRGVEKYHATVEEHMDSYVLNAHAPLAVNNQPAASVQLHNGDIITIGRFNLRFSLRGYESKSSASGSPYTRTQVNQPYEPASYSPGTQLIPRLRAVGGMLAGTVFDIPTCRVAIGRDLLCDIPLSQDTSVSRKHAEILYDNGQYIIRDLGSTNGVYVNGCRVPESPITPDDTVQIGATQFRLVFEPPVQQ